MSKNIVSINNNKAPNIQYSYLSSSSNNQCNGWAQQNEADFYKKSQSVEHLKYSSPVKKIRSKTNQSFGVTKKSFQEVYSTSRMFGRNTIQKYQSLLDQPQTEIRTGTLQNIERGLLVEEERQEGNLDQDKEIVELNMDANFKWLLKSCVEEALSFALEWAPSTIILYFITQNTDEITVKGFGIGAVWSNCIGQGLYYGLCSGFETMASHANGNKNYQLVGLLLQKTVFVSMILFIPIMLAMLFSEHILNLYNTDEQACNLASQYCQLVIPGLFVASFYYALKAFLNAQNEYRIQVYTAAINLATVVLYSYIFIQYLDMGIKGAALVFILSESTCLILLSVFTFFKKHLHKCFISLSKEIFKDLSDYLKVAVPIGSIVAAEWMIFELTAIISSNLNDNQYEAHLVLSNFSAMCFQFQIGYSTATATFISNEMGNQNVKNALKYTKYALFIILVHLCIVILPLIFLRGYIADMFTSSQEIKDNLLSVYFIFIGCFSLESFSSIASAYMRAIAQENYTSICFFLCYGGFGLVSSYLLAYQGDLGLKGIWLGMLIAVGSYIVLLAIQIFRVDINEMAKIIAERVEEEEEGQENQNDQLTIKNTETEDS
ncbi:hypothetical protein ABPG72_005952 [Tetrahymena utriculariae]